MHAVQAARKSAGLNVEDRISLRLGGDGDLIDAVRAHESYVSAETLATSLETDGADGEPVSIEGRELSISVEKSPAAA